MLLERVLIPLDGTPAAESVVPLLEPILRRSGSEVFLVRALSPSDPRPPVQEAEEYLEEIAGRFLDEGVCAHTLVGVGPASEVIASLAMEEEITLIAMGVPPGDVDPVMERLLRGSKPVLAFRQPTAPPLSGKKRRTILAPLDGSEASRRSLPLALELAGVLDARVILMRVIEQDHEELEALNELHGVARRLADQGLCAEIWIERGEPVGKILQISREEEAQLVVLTTRGRSEGPLDALGPVTLDVMNGSPVPVLAVHVHGP